MVVQNDYFIPKDEFYRKYSEYCHAKSLSVLTKNMGSKQIVRFIPTISTARPKIEDSQIYCWTGIYIAGEEIKPYIQEEALDSRIAQYQENSGGAE